MSIHTEYTTYSIENTKLKGYLAWNGTTDEKRPGTLAGITLQDRKDLSVIAGAEQV